MGGEGVGGEGVGGEGISMSQMSVHDDQNTKTLVYLLQKTVFVHSSAQRGLTLLGRKTGCIHSSTML